jgi:hypothetical protein
LWLQIIIKHRDIADCFSEEGVWYSEKSMDFIARLV